MPSQLYFGKLCRARSNTTDRGIWSRSRLFALNTRISIKTTMIISKSNQAPINLKMGRSNCGREIHWELQVNNLFESYHGTQYIRRGDSNAYPQSMILSRNKKNNVYPFKPQFYYINVGFKGSTLYRHVLVMKQQCIFKRQVKICIYTHIHVYK